jgi:hypothetical protein
MASVQLPTAGPTAEEPRVQDWWLEQDEHGVTACNGRRPIAHVEVHEDDDRVQLYTRLTSMAFEHPSLGPQRWVSAAFPHRETDVLLEMRSHVAVTSTRVAGTTCLLDGRVN